VVCENIFVHPGGQGATYNISLNEYDCVRLPERKDDIQFQNTGCEYALSITPLDSIAEPHVAEGWYAVWHPSHTVGLFQVTTTGPCTNIGVLYW
jgi:hypothetical protein